LNDFIITPRPGLWRPIHGALLIALFVAEALIFYVHVTRDVAPFYPPRFDQLSYYLETYDLIGAVHAKGFSALLDELLRPGNATGTTFVLQGALLALIAGDNRTAILSINLSYFLALQFVFFFAIRSRTGRIDFAWLGMALLLSSHTLFNTAGGIYDYRIDFSALCLYGICTCLIVWSGAFRHTGRVFVVALACILLVYDRFFTIIYVAGVLGVLLAINMYEIWQSSSTGSKTVAVRRARNILLSGMTIAVVCLPRLYLSRSAIYGYYVVGHVLGEEKFIRAHELGLHTVADHLFFYPRSILDMHVGKLTFLIAGVLMSWRLWSDRVPLGALLTRPYRFKQEFVSLGVAVLIPIAVLTTNISKSSVVGGIVVVPIVLAMVLFGASVWPRPTPTARRPSWTAKLPGVAMALAFIALALRGLSSQDLVPRADLERITLLGETIARYAADNNLERLTMSTDRVIEYENAGIPKLFSIERLHRKLDVEGLFGHSIFATPRDEAMRLFAESDVIVLTDPTTDRQPPYPINSKINEYWDDVWQQTNRDRKLIYSTEILGIPYHVFVRPLPKVGSDPEKASLMPHIPSLPYEKGRIRIL
jgi:hypothetical protein